MVWAKAGTAGNTFPAEWDQQRILQGETRAREIVEDYLGSRIHNSQLN